MDCMEPSNKYLYFTRYLGEDFFLQKMGNFFGDHERLQKLVISNLDYSNKSFFRNQSSF